MKCNTSAVSFFLLLFLIAGLSFEGYCQEKDADKVFIHELRATTVNDSYFGLRQDHYFTNGLLLNYSRWLEEGVPFLGFIPKEQQKAIFNIKLAHQVYTPRLIQNADSSLMDRPYAGYLYLQATLDSFWKQRNNFSIALNVGVIGPASGAEKIQKKWHRWFGLAQPKGWQYQISNEPVINLNLKYRHSWFLSSEVDAIVGTGFNAGTAFNDISAEAMLRFGNINPIDHSAITYSQLGGLSNSFGNYLEKEWFLFFGLEDKLVIHNTLIEGGLISPSKKVLDRKAEPNVFSVKWGGAFSLRRFTWRLNMTRLSPEVVGAQKHILVSFDMGVRF